MAMKFVLRLAFSNKTVYAKCCKSFHLIRYYILNRRVVIPGITLVIICTWVFLKFTGDIGRQFNNGLNIRETFPITSVNDEFLFKINPTRKGVYIYSAAFSYDKKSILQSEDTLEFEAKFTEKLCGTSNALGSVTYNVRDTHAKRIYKGFPRYGKVVKAPFFNRSEAICLNVEITKIPEIQTADLKLGVSAHNTRPCWFFTCLLD